MALSKLYSRIEWENEPSTKTPLNATNLNKIDSALDEIDNRVISIDTTKATKVEVSELKSDLVNQENEIKSQLFSHGAVLISETNENHSTWSGVTTDAKICNVTEKIPMTSGSTVIVKAKGIAPTVKPTQYSGRGVRIIALDTSLNQTGIFWDFEADSNGDVDAIQVVDRSSGFGGIIIALFLYKTEATSSGHTEIIHVDSLVSYGGKYSINTQYVDDSRIVCIENNVNSNQVDISLSVNESILLGTLADTSNSKLLKKDSLSWTATTTNTWVTSSYLTFNIDATKGDSFLIGALYMDSLSQQLIHVIEKDGNGETLKTTILVKNKYLDSNNKINPIPYIVENENTITLSVLFGIRFNGQISGYDDVVVGKTYHIYNAYILSGYADYYRKNEFLYDLPDSWSNKLETIRQMQGDKIIFVVQTDTHYRPDYAYSKDDGLNLSKLTEFIGLDFVCNLGDIIHGYADETIDNTTSMRKAYTQLIDRYTRYLRCPMLITFGNHDANKMYADYKGDSSLIISNAERYARAIMPTKNSIKDVSYNGKSTYYFVDFNDSNIRVIMLDSCYYDGGFAFGETQTNWFTTTALDTNKSIIVMTHIPLVAEIQTDGNGVYDQDTIINALKSFKNDGGDVIGCFYGHTHEQNTVMVDGIRHVVFDNGGDIAEVVMINKETRTINTITLGFDGNREFGY